MGKGYQRADSLAEILAKRAEKQRLTPADRCRQIVDNSTVDKMSTVAKYGTLANPYQFKTTGMKLEVIEEKDLRKEIPGQLDLQTKESE